jgi:hypothetical protein
MNHILKYIKKYLYCARKSSFGPKTKALKNSKNFKKKRPPANFLAKAKDANQPFFFMWPKARIKRLEDEMSLHVLNAFFFLLSFLMR